MDGGPSHNAEAGPSLTQSSVIMYSCMDLAAFLPAPMAEMTVAKDFYTTKEISALLGVSEFTVRERYCNQGRIEAEKDPVSGKWRIPGHEYERLRRGGRPLGI